MFLGIFIKIISELDGYIITQNTLNDLGTLTNVKEM